MEKLTYNKLSVPAARNAYISFAKQRREQGFPDMQGSIEGALNDLGAVFDKDGDRV